MNQIRFSCPCIFGLESVLSGEINRLEGTSDIVVSDGKVEFSGDESLVARSNLWLRTAERVLIVIGEFEAKTFTQLFDEVFALRWEDYLGSKDAFPVKGWALNSQLHSVPDCQSIIKKAIAKRLGLKYSKAWLEETGPIHQIQFSIMKDRVSIMIDTSGEGLHKRGYRKNSNIAPIKETLAAGILDIARIYPDTKLYDPFCGSGTLLIEAALKAKNQAPGYYRDFSAKHWDCFPSNIWETEKQNALNQMRINIDFFAKGSDINEDAVSLASLNARKAGVGPLISCKKADIIDFQIPDEKSLVVCNPPYGERMMDEPEIAKLYKNMGTIFKPSDHVSYYIISSVYNFEELFGRKADKRRKLYNGMLKCQLYMYFPKK